ncbi:replication protein A 70 kDa DNA-binding subunit B-like [Papaver somniferum]|uniref:replication protein A 70 kDa DNA-binding subunit B-like n=1 Tax=Papaver somniferum TaxID=3469 RepID=UPI000E6FBD5A|nr:replication protein A 70 kDa DNA-binding subunit B-like [Papaver somniferum]
MTIARTLTGIPYFNWNTDITPLETTSASIPRHKFNFTELENLAAATTNTYLTDVVVVLTSHTNLQQVKRSSGNVCFMRELTLENLSGMKLKVTLWGDSTSELTRNLEAHELNPQPVVAVVTGVYVKQYPGKVSPSSTNATQIFFDLDIPEVLHIIERSSYRTSPLEITIPARVGYNQAVQSIGYTRMLISQLMETKGESGYNILNRKVCRAKAIGISTEKGWYYLRCHNCTTKLVGNKGDHWCPSRKVQVDEPVPRYLLRLEVEDSSGTAFFVAMDSEVQKMASFSNQVEGFATVQTAFESLIAPTPTISAQVNEISRPEDEPVVDNEPPRKKPCLQKMPNSASASTVAED